MSKRISTLMTMDLLTAGALFTTANAQTTKEAVDTQFSGSKHYYLANENSGTHSYAGGQSMKKGAAKQYIVLNITAETDKDVAGGDGTYLQVISHVTYSDKSCFVFRNREAGTLLSFVADGIVITTADTGKADESTWLDANKYIQTGKAIQTADASHQTGFSGITWSINSSGVNIQIFAQDAASVSVGDLNAALGNGFALGFPAINSQSKENISDQRIRAYNSAGEIWTTNLSSPSETYFVVSAPKGGIVDEATLKASTFIVVGPVNHFGINALRRADGVGFTFKLVSGENLTMTVNTSREQVYAGSAVFTISEMDNVNKPDEYTSKLSSVYVKKDTAKDNQAMVPDVYVNAIASTGTTHVTTTNKLTTAKCMISTSDMLKISGLLSGDTPSVSNVLFISNKEDATKSDSSEYGKYLDLKVGTSDYESFAQGPGYVNLDAPQNQWVVIRIDGQKFMFTNREVNTCNISTGAATGLSFTASLRKTDKANVYEVDAESKTFTYAHVTNSSYTISNDRNLATAGGLKTKLIPATAIPSTGCADYPDAEPAELVRLKSMIGSNVLHKDLYLKAKYADSTPSPVKATREALDAAEWEVIEFDRSATGSNMAKSDVIYGSTKYAYIVKDGETKARDVKDIAITSCAFKLHMNGRAFYLNEVRGNYSPIQGDNMEDAPRFTMKGNKNGFACLAKAGAEREHTEIAGKNTRGLALNSTDGKLIQESICATAEDVRASFFVVRDTTTPSLSPVPRYASFQVLEGGFVAVGEANDAIIAPTNAGAEDLTFRSDTVDTKTYTPSFCISKGAGTAVDVPRMFLYNAKDSASYHSPGSASLVTDDSYKLVGRTSTKVIFRPAILIGIDTLSTTVEDKGTEITTKNGLNNLRFQTVLKDVIVEGRHIIKSLSSSNCIFNLDGKLGFMNDKSETLVVSVESGIIPTSNESIDSSASSIVVTDNVGSVTVQDAQGETAHVRNLLGMPLTETVVASDNAMIAAPAGIILATVGDEAVRAIVK